MPANDPRKQELLDSITALGGPRALDERMERFHRSVLMTETDEFRARYPDKWVAVLDSDLLAVADDFASLSEQIEERGLNQDGLYVTLIEVTPRTLIL
jgi:Family of unknown function (DUF5678)